MIKRTKLISVAALLLALPAGCEDNGDGGGADDDSDTNEADISVCAPENGPFSLNIDNEWFPLSVGLALVLEGEQDGAEVRVEFDVLNETKKVAGVTTRVVTETEYEDGELVEISRNYFAQAPDGTVCYFGEDVDEYEDGVVAAHGGAWLAGEGENLPGIIMPAVPAVGMKYQQEYAPGIAEDSAEITAMGEPLSVPAGEFFETLTVLESDPLDSGSSDKIYIKGISMAYDDGIELISYKSAAKNLYRKQETN